MVGHFGQAQGLHAHANAGCIHHHKHGGQTFVGLTHHGAHGVFQNHLAGGVAVDAHLVFQAAAMDAISLTQTAIRIHHELGHDKQADAFAACGRVGQTGQHQVDDVFSQVVFACADENFGT